MNIMLTPTAKLTSTHTHTHTHTQVEFDETTGLPTNQLSPVGVAACQRVGSSALTVSDILDHGGDHRVLRMIQKGIDAVNKRALLRAQKVTI